MGDALNILPYVKTPDFVGPLEAALRMHESRVNSDTQRMYAQNQMARESAQEFRDKRDYEEKQKDKERQDKLDAAAAVGTINQMLGPRDEKGRPVNLGPAMALASAHGIDLHPLLATTAAAHAAQGDAVDQALAEAGPTGNAPPAAPQAPPVAPGGDSSIPRETPGVDPGVAAIMQGRTVQSAPEGDFVLPPGTPANLAAASAHTGYVPQGSELLPPQARPPAPPPPVPAGPPPELEALMAGAHPEFAGAKYEAPTNPLYEAVMGGQHYQLGGQASGSGLGEKYDKVYGSLVNSGTPPLEARKLVEGMYAEDNKAQNRQTGTAAAIGARSAETDKRDAEFRLTADEQKQRDAARLAMSERVARIKAAAFAPGLNPKAQEFLPIALRMAENGASDSEIAAAAPRGVDPKVWTGQVNAEDRKANADLRSQEKRAGLEATDDQGNKIGVWKDQAAAKVGRDNLDNYHRVKERLDALIADIEQNGEHTALSRDQIQHRISLGQGVVAALRPWNKLSNTAAGQQMEADIVGALGAPGHGWLWGANTDVIKHLRDEAEGQNKARLSIYLRAGGGQALPPAVTHEKTQGGARGGNPNLNQLEDWLTTKGY